jgi:hypothetical protein
MTHSALRFQFDEKKAVEALTYIASKWPGITAFFAAKVLFSAKNALSTAITITKQRYSRIRAQREADHDALSRSAPG